MKNQDKKRTNEPYEKPVLRKIDLIAEEVLAVGCKSQVSGSRGAHPAWCRTAPREARSNRSQIIVFTVGLTIAGVRLFIQSRHSELPGSLDPPYLPFTGYDLDYSSSISVDLLVDTLTDTGRLRKVFDSNESWSLLTDESSFFIIMNPADLGSRQPVWVAEVAKSFERATVHCGEMLVEYHDGEIRVSSPVCYPLDQILLMHHLSGRSGVIVHGAGISINSKGYVFAGRCQAPARVPSQGY